MGQSQACLHTAQGGQLARLVEQASAVLGEADLARILALYAADLDPLAAHAYAATPHCLAS